MTKATEVSTATSSMPESVTGNPKILIKPDAAEYKIGSTMLVTMNTMIKMIYQRQAIPDD